MPIPNVARMIGTMGLDDLLYRPLMRGSWVEIAKKKKNKQTNKQILKI